MFSLGFYNRLSENKVLRVVPRTFSPIIYTTVSTVPQYSDQPSFCTSHYCKLKLKVQDNGQLGVKHCKAS